MTMVIIWLIIIVAFVVAEAATTQLVSIWFVPGSVAALILAGINAKLWLQILAFAVFAVALLILARPAVSRYIGGRVVPTNLDRAIGQTALVIEDIGDGVVGQVKVNGLVWSAVSTQDSLIKKGEHVTVKAIEGVKLIVEEIKKVEAK